MFPFGVPRVPFVSLSNKDTGMSSVFNELTSPEHGSLVCDHRCHMSEHTPCSKYQRASLCELDLLLLALHSQICKMDETEYPRYPHPCQMKPLFHLRGTCQS
mmetsp:Transcript_92929/g.165253  ORF Transcript_92929/g.165253 Transcript_92929/m.165253 type:complete len:102 (-) Transcript_92929:1777-2082(-)